MISIFPGRLEGGSWGIRARWDAARISSTGNYASIIVGPSSRYTKKKGRWNDWDCVEIYELSSCIVNWSSWEKERSFDVSSEEFQKDSKKASIFKMLKIFFRTNSIELWKRRRTMKFNLDVGLGEKFWRMSKLFPRVNLRCDSFKFKSCTSLKGHQCWERLWHWNWKFSGWMRDFLD